MKEGFVVVEELSIPSSFDSIHKVEQLVDDSCAKLGVREDEYGNVLIAVTEAVNNAVIHGNMKDKDLDVKVSVADNAPKRRFCFNVVDAGRGFDYNNLPDPTAPENIEKEFGRGIFLMRNLADEVQFENGGRSVFIYFSK